MTQINQRDSNPQNKQGENGAGARLRSNSGQGAGQGRRGPPLGEDAAKIAGLAVSAMLKPRFWEAEDQKPPADSGQDDGSSRVELRRLRPLGQSVGDQSKAFETSLRAQAGPDGVFTSVSELKTALTSLKIKADDKLLAAIFATTSSRTGVPPVSKLDPSAVVSLVYDWGPPTAKGQTTPGVLDLRTDATGTQTLSLSSSRVSAYDKLRFAWTGDADASTLKARLVAAGYRLQPADGAALDWLATKSSAASNKISWQEFNAFVVNGALDLGKQNPYPDRPRVVVDKTLIDQILTGVKFDRDTRYDDLGTNAAVVDLSFAAPTAKKNYQNDNDFSKVLQALGLTVDPTQLGLLRNTVPSGKLVAGVPQLNQIDVAKAVNSGVLKYEFTSDGKLQLSLADPNAALKIAIGKAPGTAGAPESITAAQLAKTLNSLTGTQLSKLSTADAQYLIDNYVKGGTGTLRQRLQGAVDAKALTVSSPSGSKTLSIAVNRSAAPGEGGSANGAVSGQVYVAGVRTPVAGGSGLDKVYNTNLLDASITNLGQFADRYNETEGAFVIGATQYRADRQASGQIAVEMAVVGTNQWTTVFTGGADSIVKGVETYEWDVGATGAFSAKGGTGGDNSTTTTGGEYSRLKVFKQFWVFEKDQGGSATDLDNKSFRSRTYFPFPVLTEVGGAVNGEAGGSLAGNYWVDLRWGRISGTPSPTTPATIVEWGANFNIGAQGAFDVIKHAAAGDWNAVAQDAAALPRLGAQLALWRFGLFGLQDGANKLATKIEGQAPPSQAGTDSGSKWYRSVPADVVRFLGKTFQHSALVAQAGVTGSASAKSLDTSAAGDGPQTKLVTPPNGSVPTTGPFASLLSVVDEQPDLGPAQAVFDALENVDLSKYGSVIGDAKDAIKAAAAAQAVKNLLKGHGLSSLDDLSKENQNKLFDLVMEEATQLMLADSTTQPGRPSDTAVNPLGPASPLSQDQQQKNLLLNPGETPAQYVERLMSNIAKKLPQAARNVLFDTTTYDVDLKLPKPPTAVGPLAALVGVLAGAIATVVSAQNAAGTGTDPAKGNSVLVGALKKAKATLERAQALVNLINKGGPVANHAVAIEQMRAELLAASFTLSAAVQNNPGLDAPTKTKVNDVLGAITTVSGALKNLLLSAAHDRLPDDLVDDALDAGFTSPQILPTNATDLAAVLSLLADSPERETLFKAIQTKLNQGWTISDVVDFGDGTNGLPFARALGKITLAEAQSPTFGSRYDEGLDYLLSLFNSDRLVVEPPSKDKLVENAVVYARYYASTTVAERQRPSFLNALVAADASKGSPYLAADVVAEARLKEEKF